MNYKYFLGALTLIISLSLFSCEVKPSPINYGHDACHSCRMTIVDKAFASEIVTTKGKSFKYDAIECMIEDFKKRPLENIKFILVTDFKNPGTLVNASEMTFIVDPKIKSPMGANLHAEMKNHNPYTKNYSWKQIQKIKLQQDFY